MPKKFRLSLLVISLLILSSLYIRTMILDLPYHYNVDESYYYESATNIRNTGWQSQRFYPPLVPYLTSVVSIVMDAASGWVQNATVDTPTYVGGRLLSVLATLFACCCLYRIGRYFQGDLAGFALLWLYGTNSNVFSFSWVIHGDAIAWPLMSLSVFLSLMAISRPKNNRLIIFATLVMILAILAKYSVAPAAIFVAYLWFRKFIPNIRTQLILFAGLFIGMLVLGASVKYLLPSSEFYFRRAGFVFLYAKDFFNLIRLNSAINTMHTVTSPIVTISMPAVLLLVLTFNRSWIAKKSIALVLSLIAIFGMITLSTIIPFSRYRDMVVMPYFIVILWATLAVTLARMLPKRLGVGIFMVVAGFLIITGFTQNLKESNEMRKGDYRAATSQWMVANLHRPTQLIKEYTLEDFLPHSDSYPGGYHRWNIVKSILDKKPEQWFAEGNLYALTDTRKVTNSWFSDANNKLLYKGFTLAYETPDTPGGKMGYRTAIFYTFPVRQVVNGTFDDLAQVIGYNVDLPVVCQGSKLPLRINMRALRTTDIYYESKVTIRDSKDTLVLVESQAPGLGIRPTTIWELNEIIFDDHWITIPSEMITGTYSLEMTLFEPYHKTASQLFDSQGQATGDALKMGTIQVKPCLQF